MAVSLARAVGASIAVTTTTSMPAVLVGALAIQLKQSLDFDAAGLGIAISAYSLAAAVCSMPMARMVARVGAAKAMLFAALISICAMALVAGVVSTWLELLFVLMIAGVATSVIQPATNTFLGRAAGSAHQGLAFGLKQAAIPGATLVGGLAVPLIVHPLGWRLTFFVGALATGLVLTLVVQADVVHLSDPRLKPESIRAATTERKVLMLLALGFGIGMIAASILPAFLVLSGGAAGLTNSDAGLVEAACGALAILVRVVAGFYADRRKGRHLHTVAIMVGLGAAGFGCVSAGIELKSTPLFVLGGLIAFGAGWGWNGLLQLAVTRAYPETVASATAVLQTAGRFASVLGPLAFGFISAHSSIATAWALIAICGVSSAAVILTVGRMTVGHGPALAI